MMRIVRGYAPSLSATTAGVPIAWRPDPGGRLDTILARKMWATLEPYHAMVYFAPESFAAWDGLGLTRPGMGYFASRSAVMGAVEAPVVAAAFYNFNPALIARSIPAAWSIASPTTMVETRFDVAGAALRRLVPEPEQEELAWAAATAEEAAGACPPDGRPLFAAHVDVTPPDDPLLGLWWALTRLREFRGDGHVMALVDADLSGVESVVSYVATGQTPFDADFYRTSRGWDLATWDSAVDRLKARGWVGDDGSLTPEGVAGREAVEAHTDRLSMAPWRAIGQERADRLRATVRPWSRAIVSAGGLRGRSL